MPLVKHRILLVLFALGPTSLACTGCNKADETTASAQTVSLEDALVEAAARVRDDQLDQAQIRYDKLLEQHPEDPRVLAGVAALRRKQGRDDEARPLLEQATTKPNAPAEAFAALGDLLTQRKEHAAAARAYAQARAKAPDNSAYGLAEGNALLAANEPAKAEAVLRDVAKLDPKALDADKVGVHTRIADALRARDALDEALRMYMKAQNTWSSDKMAHAGAAFVYEAKGDIRHALDEWSAYIRMDCCSDYSNEVAKKKFEALSKAE